MRTQPIGLLVLTTSTIVCGSAACLADGQGVLVQAQGDRLVVGFDDDTPGGQSIGARVFGELLPPTGLSQDPSFLSLSTPPAGAEALPVGVGVYWDFLPMTIDGVTSNLFHWDGVGETDFQPTQAETLTLYDPAFTPATVDGAAAAVPGLRLGTTTASALSLHAHRWWQLQGDNEDDPTPGVYATALRLRADGYVPSEPIFVALSTFGTPSSVLNDTAMPWLEENLDDLILRGDYDFNGVVDAADYELWSDQYGATTPQPVDVGEADGNGDGRIDAADYTVWRDALTATAPAAKSLPIPEPGGAALLIAAMWSLAPSSTRRPEQRTAATSSTACTL